MKKRSNTCRRLDIALLVFLTILGCVNNKVDTQKEKKKNSLRENKAILSELTEKHSAKTDFMKFMLNNKFGWEFFTIELQDYLEQDKKPWIVSAHLLDISKSRNGDLILLAELGYPLPTIFLRLKCKREIVDKLLSIREKAIFAEIALVINPISISNPLLKLTANCEDESPTIEPDSFNCWIIQGDCIDASIFKSSSPVKELFGVAK